MQRDDDNDEKPPAPPQVRRRLSLYRYQKIGLPLLALLPVLAMAGVLGQKVTTQHAAGAAMNVAVTYPARLNYNLDDQIILRIRNLGSQTELVTQGMNRDDESLTHSLVGVATLLTLVFLTSMLAYRSRQMERVLGFEPAVLVRRGALVQKNLDHERVPPEEIFDALHEAGLLRLEQVQWAILESDGRITIIPADKNESDGVGQSDKKPV